MINFIKKNWLALVASFYSLLVALFWLALRVNWSGISKALGADTNPSFIVMNLPLLFCIFMWIVFAFAVVCMFVWKRKLPSIITLAISGVFTVIIIVVIALGACDYMTFVLPKFWRSLLISVALIALAVLLFFPVSNSKRSVAIKAACLACLMLLSIFVGYDVHLGNKFSYGAVVYAVEDDYQIVFSTSSNSIAWVEVGNESYFDLYAGSMKSDDLVHKVTVPQSKLDAAKGYTICAQKMIYRGPFGGYKGKVISQSYNFRPVDSSDGLVYYSMSDVHGAKKGAVNTAKSVQKLDFLVMLGDNISMVDSEADAQYANLLASEITAGQIPCIYLRGNHEIKGNYAEQLYKYVGSKNGNFYYWFTLSDVFGITLDLGEDHDDDWWEYYGTAQFAQYHAEQTQMLTQLVSDHPYDGFNYKLVCCHIPIQFINSRGNHKDVKTAWTALINQIEPDLVVSGHQHDLYPFLEGQIDINVDGRLIYNSQYVNQENKLYGKKGGVTDFHFNSFIVGKRGATQDDEPGATNLRDHIGLVTEVNFAAGTQTSKYINSRGQTVSVFMPFRQGPAQTEFVTQLKTK